MLSLVAVVLALDFLVSTAMKARRIAPPPQYYERTSIACWAALPSCLRDRDIFKPTAISPCLTREVPMAVVELLPIPAEKSESDNPTSSSRLKSVADALGDIRSIFISIMLGIVILFVISSVVMDVVSPTICLKPIRVPVELKKLGYTDDIVAQRLLEQINVIRSSNKSQRSLPNFSSTLFSPDITISETGVSHAQVLHFSNTSAFLSQ
jgi:hypothetical protein